MRRMFASILGLALLLPGVAQAVDPPDCARLIRQYQHFKGMQDRAEELGNDAWAEGMGQHVALIEAELDSRCPEFTAERRAFRAAMRQFAELIKAGASAAATFFTGGAL